jgi:DNA-binding transcriptional MerR regulator
MYDRAELSERTGIDTSDIDRMVSLGVIEPSRGEHFSDGDLRRAMVIQEFERGGLPLDKLAEAMRAGRVSLANDSHLCPARPSPSLRSRQGSQSACCWQSERQWDLLSLNPRTACGQMSRMSSHLHPR